MRWTVGFGLLVTVDSIVFSKSFSSIGKISGTVFTRLFWTTSSQQLWSWAVTWMPVIQAFCLNTFQSMILVLLQCHILVGLWKFCSRGFNWFWLNCSRWGNSYECVWGWQDGHQAHWCRVLEGFLWWCLVVALLLFDCSQKNLHKQ